PGREEPCSPAIATHRPVSPPAGGALLQLARGSHWYQSAIRRKISFCPNFHTRSNRSCIGMTWAMLPPHVLELHQLTWARLSLQERVPMATVSCPKVPAKAWGLLRSRAVTAPSTKFTPTAVAAMLDMSSPKSAADNIVYPMRRLGLIDDEGAL